MTTKFEVLLLRYLLTELSTLGLFSVVYFRKTGPEPILDGLVLGKPRHFVTVTSTFFFTLTLLLLIASVNCRLCVLGGGGGGHNLGSLGRGRINVVMMNTL